MTKEDNEDFENSNKCWICDNTYVDCDVKVTYHYHITGKYRGSAHIDCNINVKLNHKIPVLFRNLKNYDSHLILQELGKFNLKINVIHNGLEKYMSFSISNKLSFIDSFQFVSSSLDSVVKISDKEYNYVLKDWNKFEMKTMKDYHDLYLKCDFLLLTDVFEKFGNNSIKNYGLCPSHYLNAPALSWDAM